jgi:hypothetical protein
VTAFYKLTRGLRTRIDSERGQRIDGRREVVQEVALGLVEAESRPTFFEKEQILKKTLMTGDRFLCLI